MKIWGYFIHVDSVVLDMETTKELPLILGRPFLSTAWAQIDVEARETRFNFIFKEENSSFSPDKDNVP